MQSWDVAFLPWCGIKSLLCDMFLSQCVWSFSYVLRSCHDMVTLICCLVSLLCGFVTSGTRNCKRCPSSCSSALSKISRQPFRLACEGRKRHGGYTEGPQTRVCYSKICCGKNWAWKCIRVVRCWACTSWCNYDRGSSLYFVHFVLPEKKTSVHSCSCS